MNNRPFIENAKQQEARAVHGARGQSNRCATWWDLVGLGGIWDLVGLGTLVGLGGTWWDLVGLGGTFDFGGTLVGLLTLVGLGGTWRDLKVEKGQVSESADRCSTEVQF